MPTLFSSRDGYKHTCPVLSTSVRSPLDFCATGFLSITIFSARAQQQFLFFPVYLPPCPRLDTCFFMYPRPLGPSTPQFMTRAFVSLGVFPPHFQSCPPIVFARFSCLLPFRASALRVDFLLPFPSLRRCLVTYRKDTLPLSPFFFFYSFRQKRPFPLCVPAAPRG